MTPAVLLHPHLLLLSAHAPSKAPYRRLRYPCHSPPLTGCCSGGSPCSTFCCMPMVRGPFLARGSQQQHRSSQPATCTHTPQVKRTDHRSVVTHMQRSTHRRFICTDVSGGSWQWHGAAGQREYLLTMLTAITRRRERRSFFTAAIVCFRMLYPTKALSHQPPQHHHRRSSYQPVETAWG